MRSERATALAPSHADLAAMWRLSTDLFGVIQEGRLLEVNPAWTRVLGWSREELLTMCTSDLVHPDDLESMLAVREAAADSPELIAFESRYRHADGSYRWLLWSGYLEGDRWYAVAKDITRRKEAELESLTSAKVLDTVDAAIMAVDLDGNLTRWSRGAERLYGWEAEEVLGRSLLETAAPAARQSAGEVMRAARETGVWEGEYTAHRRDGIPFPAYLRCALVTDSDGRAEGLVGVIVDVSSQHRAQRQLSAATNYLSAVTNSMGEGVYTLDVDGNLVYMNAAAERLLGWSISEIAGENMHRRSHHTRADGTPHPIEECPLLRARVDGQTVRVEDDVFIRRDGTPLPVQYTAAPFVTAEGVLGTVCVFDDISARKAEEEKLRGQLERLSWIGRIREALLHDRFVLHAQPIVDVKSGEVVTHELLIRMLDENGGEVAPGLFLPAAEESGQIRDIDRWVIRQAAGVAAQGRPIELNLSAESISDRTLAAYFETELRDAGADPSLIVIELTETALLRDAPAGKAFVERMAALGCKIALDDFGTGYGGFTYLKRLPVDYLKIDIEFVRDLPRDAASQHVVRAVVDLARAFGQQTVGEGVEDAETLSMLREFGVDLAQGYGIGRPALLDGDGTA